LRQRGEFITRLGDTAMFGGVTVMALATTVYAVVLGYRLSRALD
jgi:hypothetical protein